MAGRIPSGRKKTVGSAVSDGHKKDPKGRRPRVMQEAVFSGEVLPDFLSLAENSPNMIFINYRGRVVYANRLCEKIMGYTKHEFYAPDFDFRRLIALESLPLIEKRFAGHMKGQEQEPYEYQLVCRDGKTLDAVISTKLVDYEEGKAILGIITDVSRYRKIEGMIEHERDLQKMYMNVADVFLVVLDMRGRITAINRKGCDLLGMEESDLVGKDWVSHFVPKEERERAWITLDRKSVV